MAVPEQGDDVFGPACFTCIRGSSNRCGVRLVDFLQYAAAVDLDDATAFGRGFAGVALMIPTPHFCSMDRFLFRAARLRLRNSRHRGGRFLSAGGDGAEQSFFIGFRGIFLQRRQDLRAGWHRLSRRQYGNGAPATDFRVVGGIGAAAMVFICLGVYHRFILPRPQSDQPKFWWRRRSFIPEVLKTFGTFSKTRKSCYCCFFFCSSGWARRNSGKCTADFSRRTRQAGGLELTAQKNRFRHLRHGRR